MKASVQKFVGFERELSAERGAFALFGLFQREDAQGLWDFVLSAPWFGEDKRDSLQLVVKRTQSLLELAERALLSRIVLLDPTDSFVRNINQAIRVEHGQVEVKECVFNGVVIKYAFIITSQALPPNNRINPAAGGGVAAG